MTLHVYQNTFKKDLEYSQSTEVTEFWRSAHSSAFAGFEGMEEVTDLEAQANGLDRLVHTTSGSIWIEEKVDSHAPRNFCLEIEGSYGNAGWYLHPQLSQVFAVAYIKHDVVYYFDTTSLFDTIAKNYSGWYSVYKPFRIVNGSALVMLIPLEQLTSLVPHRRIHVNRDYE